MDLAYVDELDENIINLKYLLVRENWFDRTVDAKGMNTKDSKETVRAFVKMITRKNRPEEYLGQKRTEFAGEFDKFAAQKGYEYTLQSKRIRLYLLNAQDDSRKNFFPLLGRSWTLMHSHIVSIHHNPEFQKKIVR